MSGSGVGSLAPLCSLPGSMRRDDGIERVEWGSRGEGLGLHREAAGLGLVGRPVA